MVAARAALCCAFALTLAAPAAPAGAAGSAGSAAPDTSGADQYIESLPGGGGPTIPGGRGHVRPRPLSPALRRRLASAGPDAPALERLARSSDLGAPPIRRALARKARGRASGGGRSSTPDRVRGADSAFIDAIGQTGAGAVVPIAALVAAGIALTLGGARRRRRRSGA